MKRYIITGAPGTGKTTLLKKLRTKGFFCFDEVSRQIIIQQQKIKGTKIPWLDVQGFTNLVYERTLKDLQIKVSDVCFSDRSLIDNLAYLKLKDETIPYFLEEFNYHNFYHQKVFILPIWQEIYEQDPQRQQSYSSAKKLHFLLKKEYKKLGFQLCQVPKSNIQSRVTFIQQQLKH